MGAGRGGLGKGPVLGLSALRPRAPSWHLVPRCLSLGVMGAHGAGQESGSGGTWCPQLSVFGAAQRNTFSRWATPPRADPQDPSLCPGSKWALHWTSLLSPEGPGCDVPLSTVPHLGGMKVQTASPQAAGGTGRGLSRM